jgi:tellurite methyltransferase
VSEIVVTAPTEEGERAVPDVPTAVNPAGYWNDYYVTKQMSAPSPFAEFCIGRYVRPDDVVLDAGCGCGRDSVFFAAKGGAEVWSVDLSRTAIEKLRQNFPAHPSLYFRHADFTRMSEEVPELDVVYSRWTLHTIDRAGQERFLLWARRRLKLSGRLLIECRSVEDALYGVGRQVGPDEFVTTHYRRFLRMEDLRGRLEALGFTVSYCEESTGWSPTSSDDPVLIRLVAELQPLPEHSGATR